jgi:hypothetical protein
MIIPLLLLLGTTAAQCARHAQCPSNKCLGGWCCTSPDPHCAYCWGDGECAGCEMGWDFDHYKKTCTPSSRDGSFCLSPSDCDSKICKLNTCCQGGVSKNCISCSVMNGKCTYCKDGWFLDPDTRVCEPQKKIGDLCLGFVLRQCPSLCRERCCHFLIPDKCDLCGENGECKKCVDGWLLVNGVCIPINAREGSRCERGEECRGGKCLNGICCNQPGCENCDKYGICVRCKEGWNKRPGDGICAPPKYFTCARNQNIIEKRYCNSRKGLGERCCWSCEFPCKLGLKCTPVTERKGVCIYDT